MYRDPYKSYLDVIKNKDIQKPRDARDVNKEFEAIKNDSNEVSNKAIDILKEISQKLDKLGTVNNDGDAVSFEESTQHSYTEIDLAIINGNVVIPGTGIIKTNVYVNNGKIHSLVDNNKLKAKEIIDASNKYIIPGVIDPHVHLGLFAPLRKELESETKAALFGGITTIGCYFGGSESHFSTFPTIMKQIDNYSYTDIIPHLVIGSTQQKNEISDYIKHFGITSFKVYMNGIPGMIPDVDDGFIMEVMNEIKKSRKRCLLCTHAENKYLVERAYAKIKREKGKAADIKDWTETHPDIAEEEAVIRLSYLAKKAGIPTYLVHISSKAAINTLRQIKTFNKYINIETTSPYLSLTRNSANDNSIKMEPPFRDTEDVEALWRAVGDDTIDTIGTDNVTITKAEKKIDSSIWDTISGYSVLETHLPILLHEGIVKRNISLEKLVSKVTKRPAEIFNVYPDKGTILPGSEADLVIIDLDLLKEINVPNLASRSDFSIYENKSVQGWPIVTIKGGKVVIKAGKYVGNEPMGECIIR